MSAWEKLNSAYMLFASIASVVVGLITHSVYSAISYFVPWLY